MKLVEMIGRVYTRFIREKWIGRRGKRNDLINFPTGLDSAGLPAGDFVPESPWRTGPVRKRSVPATDDRNLHVTNNLRDVGRVGAHATLRERATTTLQRPELTTISHSRDLFFSREIRKVQWRLRHQPPLPSAALNVSLLRFLSVNN